MSQHPAYATDDKDPTKGKGKGRYGFSCGSIPPHLARKPPALLILDIHGGPRSAEYGAPLRLRTETQLGFEMA